MRMALSSKIAPSPLPARSSRSWTYRATSSSVSGWSAHPDADPLVEAGHSLQAGQEVGTSRQDHGAERPRGAAAG